MSDTSSSSPASAEGRSPTTPRWLTILSLVLGVWMFLFGFLKFFPPISGWFASQIRNSGLPLLSIPLGMTTEMLVGLMLMVPWLGSAVSFQRRRQIIVVASLILMAQMMVAIYVHLQPAVPAEVLPLGIKMPVIPVTVLALAALNGYCFFRQPSTG